VPAELTTIWGKLNMHATLAYLASNSNWANRAGRYARASVMLALFAGWPAASPHAQTVPSALPGWQFSITPYLWAPTLDGTLQYSRPGGGAGSADARVSSINLLESLDGAAMIAAEARYDRFSVFTDFIYLSLGKSASEIRSVNFQGSRTAVSAGLNAGTESSLDGSLWTLAGAYTLAHGNWGHLDASAGFRLFSLSAKTDVRLAAAVAAPAGGTAFERTGRLDRSTDLFDGVVGLRGRIVLGSGFHLPYGFDIGAGTSRLTWQASGGIGYQTGWAGVTLGYRHLYYDQGGSKLVQDFTFSGPYLALNLTF
jgi:hypothetical protein